MAIVNRGKEQRVAYVLAASLAIAVVRSDSAALASNLKTSVSKAKVSSSESALTAYLAVVKARLQHFWFPAKSLKEHARVCFRISKDGQISWIELTDASRIESVNQAAQDAVFYSAPFPELPAPRQSLDVAVDFDSSFQSATRAGYSRPITSSLAKSAKLLSGAVMDRKQGKIDQAIGALQNALQLTPFDGRVRDQLVESYIQLAKAQPSKQSTALLHQALLIDPDSTAARKRLNELISASGKDPLSPDVRIELAREFAKTSQYDSAVCEYGEAYLLRDSPELVSEINRTCARRKSYADVKKWLLVLPSFDKPETHIALGRAYESCDEFNNALKEYESVLAQEPTNQTAKRLLADLNGRLAKGAEVPPAEEAAALLSDEFPYSKIGSVSTSVRAVENRKVTIDYLRAACPKQTIRWAVNRIPLKVYIESGYGVPGWKPQFNKFMIDAFAAWVKASEGRLSCEIVNYPKGANIICHFIADPAKGRMGGEQGVTHFQYRYMQSEPNNCLVQSAEIFILTIERHSGGILSDVAMQAVCMHELGHALGLSGHSPFNGDVMYPTLSPYDIPRGLTERDAATVKRLYQGYAHPKDN